MYAEHRPSYRNFRPVWKRKRGIVRMSNKEKATKISWLTLAFMAFSTVWGFGNITNGFVYFNGPQVIQLDLHVCSVLHPLCADGG